MDRIRHSGAFAVTLRRLLGAVQFLTIVPVHTRTAPPGEAALFFPLVGALLGAAGGVVLDAGRGYVPFALLSLLAIAFLVLITGGLHEDGFADCADGLRAWRDPWHMMRIMKDSRIGAHGAVALVLLLLVRWQALSAIAVPNVIGALAAALGIGRTAVVALLWSTPPAGGGSAMTVAQSLTSVTALLAIAQGIALPVLLLGGMTGALVLGGSTAIVLLARRYFIARIGGVTGDCLGATCLLVETYCLIVFTCQRCI